MMIDSVFEPMNAEAIDFFRRHIPVRHKCGGEFSKVRSERAILLTWWQAPKNASMTGNNNGAR